MRAQEELQEKAEWRDRDIQVDIIVSSLVVIMKFLFMLLTKILNWRLMQNVLLKIFIINIHNFDDIH